MSNESKQKKIMQTKELILESIIEHIKTCQTCKAKFKMISAHTVKAMIRDNIKELTSDRRR